MAGRSSPNARKRDSLLSKEPLKRDHDQDMTFQDNTDAYILRFVPEAFAGIWGIHCLCVESLSPSLVLQLFFYFGHFAFSQPLRYEDLAAFGAGQNFMGDRMTEI